MIVSITVADNLDSFQMLRLNKLLTTLVPDIENVTLHVHDSILVILIWREIIRCLS